MSDIDLFVGITTWNSEIFIEHCVRSVINTTLSQRAKIVVIDNNSTDKTADIAAKAGAQVYVKKCSQPDALNWLVSKSNAKYTLLIHSDVVMLNQNWLKECVNELNDEIILISPEDIGCGPYSRPFGKGMPESSFMFFDTEKLNKTRFINWKKRYGMRLPRFDIDFLGPHITHNLPWRLKRKGFEWRAMSVLISPKSGLPIYRPGFIPDVWADELSFLYYGLGNFYSLNGQITHYHNWYDRVDTNVSSSSTQTTGKDGKGFPAAYIKAYTENFLDDYVGNNLKFPSAIPPQREPVSL